MTRSQPEDAVARHEFHELPRIFQNPEPYCASKKLMSLRIGVLVIEISSLVIPSSFVIRHSDFFGIRHSDFSFRGFQLHHSTIPLFHHSISSHAH